MSTYGGFAFDEYTDLASVEEGHEDGDEALMAPPLPRGAARRSPSSSTTLTTANLAKEAKKGMG